MTNLPSVKTNESGGAMPRRRLRRARYVPAAPTVMVYQRHASDVTLGTPAAPIVVDDPLEPGKQLEVLRSLRDDPLAALHARGWIDQPQYLGGRHYQGAFALAENKRGQTWNFDRVDGGRIPEPDLSGAQIKAIADVKRARQALGPVGISIADAVLCDGMQINTVAERRGWPDRYVGARFRECLDTLAVVFGYATRD